MFRKKPFEMPIRSINFPDVSNETYTVAMSVLTCGNIHTPPAMRKTSRCGVKLLRKIVHKMLQNGGNFFASRSESCVDGCLSKRSRRVALSFNVSTELNKTLCTSKHKIISTSWPELKSTHFNSPEKASSSNKSVSKVKMANFEKRSS